jgi:hypothetical protein
MAVSDALIGHWMLIVPGVLGAAAATYFFATPRRGRPQYRPHAAALGPAAGGDVQTALPLAQPPHDRHDGPEAA